MGQQSCCCWWWLLVSWLASDKIVGASRIFRTPANQQRWVVELATCISTHEILDLAFRYVRVFAVTCQLCIAHTYLHIQLTSVCNFFTSLPMCVLHTFASFRNACVVCARSLCRWNWVVMQQFCFFLLLHLQQQMLVGVHKWTCMRTNMSLNTHPYKRPEFRLHNGTRALLRTDASKWQRSCLQRLRRQEHLHQMCISLKVCMYICASRELHTNIHTFVIVSACISANCWGSIWVERGKLEKLKR